jgi:hypothetical protein
MAELLYKSAAPEGETAGPSAGAANGASNGAAHEQAPAEDVIDAEFKEAK